MRLETWTIHGTSFHFGQHGLGQEETNAAISSDSLFAALLARLARTGGQQAAADFMRPFLADQPPFVLSSTFPLAGQVRFFPVPANVRGGEAAGVSAKQLKRLTHVSETLYRLVINGKPLAEIYNQCISLQGGSLLAAQSDLPSLPEAQRHDPSAPLWMVEQRPRVTIGRATNESAIFFTGRLVFASGAGLWFGARFMDEGRSKNLVDSLLLDLAEAGLGAERSIGFGACQIQSATPIDLPDKGNGAWTTLSRYLPCADEIPALSHPSSAYSLRQVGGWIDSPARSGQRRKTVQLLAEGSVLGPLSKTVPGETVDARPSYPTDSDPLGHPVYRCGLAMAVGIQGGV